MSAQFTVFGKLPVELQEGVWEMAVLRPGVHFLRPNSVYNGSSPLPTGQPVQVPGISEVSSMSAACERARLSRATRRAQLRAMYNGMTRIVLNPRMIHASLNPNPGPGPPVSPINRAHIVIDKEHDLYCVSSFHSPWFPDYYFSGGIAHAHPALADIRLLAVSMPMCNRARVYSICRGCRRNFGGVPHAITSRVEFCRRCIKSWVAGFRQVERVYLIVPGVRRAQIGDEDVVYRFGNSATIDAVLTALPQPPSSHTVVEYARLPASETSPATKLQGTQTIGAFGPGGPQSFDGSGISLFEVPAAEVPHTAVQVLYKMFHGACQKRVEQARNDGVFSPSSTDPIHCGGTIEFKFLSY